MMTRIVFPPRRIPHPLVTLLTLLLWMNLAAFGAVTNSLDARLKNACAEKKIDDRLNALANLAKTLSLSEIPETLAAAENLKQLRERIVLSESTFKRWGELAPADAFARLTEMPEGMSKVESLRSVVTEYARKDVRTAAAAAAKMKPGRSRDETVPMIAEAWAKTDARAAIKWVDGLPEGFPKEAALHDIAPE